VVEWQTRSTQNRMLKGVRVRIPPWLLKILERLEMIYKNRLDSMYVIADLADHSEIKDSLLSLIDKSPAGSMSNNTDRLNVTKVDWDKSTDFSRPWVSYLLHYLNPHIASVFKEMGFSKFLLKEIWFQQYLNRASHGWHTHGSHFTNVYYLELDPDSPKTVLINPFTREEFIPDVKEGQTLVFPSYVIHKSPDDFFKKRKTIVSWNSDIDIEHPYTP
jgi:hypothetical protein